MSDCYSFGHQKGQSNDSRQKVPSKIEPTDEVKVKINTFKSKRTAFQKEKKTNQNWKQRKN